MCWEDNLNSKLSIFKYTGITNNQILRIIVFFSFVLGIFFIFGFYTFSSKLKSQYLLKNGHYIYGIDNFQNDRKISSIRNRILKKFKKYSFLKIDLSKKTSFYKEIKFD